MKKYQYKYILLSKGKYQGAKFTEHLQFTFNPDLKLKEMQELCPKMEFKVKLNPKRNI
jgi:hypothetical protein